jgi:hypothetical protein
MLFLFFEKLSNLPLGRPVNPHVSDGFLPMGQALIGRSQAFKDATAKALP